MVPLLHNSWDSWNEFYNTVIQNARIIKESGVLEFRRVANGGIIASAEIKDSNTNKEHES